MKKNKKLIAAIAFILLIVLIIAAVQFKSSGASEENVTTSTVTQQTITTNITTEEQMTTETQSITTVIYPSIISDIPEYNGKAYAVINNNMPEFEDFDNITEFETYSEFDSYGRCGVAYANICKNLMPENSREEIGSIKPSGWNYNGKSNNNKYSTSLVDGGYIYNRCHLIGFQLAGENANAKNLVTGTRYMNVTGMLPFENMVADHIKEDGGHVLYRVTPKYVDDELVCRGVQIEAYSVEDDGDSICFNVFCFNVQPGIAINYATGQNWLGNTTTVSTAENTTSKTSSTASQKYVINKSSNKFHKATCNAVEKISDDNKSIIVGNRNDLIKKGYTPCKSCNP